MSLLNSLRSATAHCHQALESEMNLLERLRKTESRRETLIRFHGLYAPLEERLGSACDWARYEWDFEGRRKLGWLAQDLREAGVGRPEDCVRCERLPALIDFESAVGCLYVLEGSTLGGQMITRMLLNPNAGPPVRMRFFQAYGSETPQRWREFCLWAEHHGSREFSHERAASAAVDTFDAFSRWFKD